MTLNSIYDMIMFIVAIMRTHCIERADVHIAINAFTEASKVLYNAFITRVMSDHCMESTVYFNTFCSIFDFMHFFTDVTQFFNLFVCSMTCTKSCTKAFHYFTHLIQCNDFLWCIGLYSNALPRNDHYEVIFSQFTECFTHRCCTHLQLLCNLYFVKLFLRHQFAC